MNIYQILSPEDAGKMLATVATMDWDVGKARTKELTGTVKQNMEILPQNNKDAKKLLMAVADQIMRHRQVSLNCIPYKLHPPKFNKYVEGSEYKPHTDAPWMAETRTDLSCTLWLSEPDSYEGGVLSMGGQEFKGKPGQALFYNCDKIHSVSPVTKGERICVITWVQSRIRDPIKRKMISDFRRWLAKMEGTPMFDEGSIIYSSLLKRWME